MKKHSEQFKLTAFIFILVLMVVPAAFAVGQPTLIWQKTYINENTFVFNAGNNFMFDPTDSNRILNILISQSPSRPSYWNMTLLYTNTGEFVSEPIEFIVSEAHKDSSITWFYGLGASLRELTYYLKNDTMTFVGVATTAVAGLPIRLLYFQKFRTHLSNDGLSLVYNSNGTIFSDTNVAICQATDTLLNYFASVDRFEELYYVRDSGYMTRKVDTTKSNISFTICRIDTTLIEPAPPPFHNNPFWKSYKRDTITHINLLEDVIFLGYPGDRFISSFWTPRYIDINDTLTVLIADVTRPNLHNRHTDGPLIVYYNRKTGVIFDKIYVAASSQYRALEGYVFDWNKDIIYIVNEFSNQLMFSKRTISNQTDIESYKISLNSTPLLSGRNLSRLPSHFHILDSIVYIYGVAVEADVSSVYLAKYKITKDEDDIYENKVELLWEYEVESEHPLGITRDNILIRGNDIYLCAFRSPSSAQTPLVIKYLKISETTSVEEIDNGLFGNRIKIYPNPTTHTLTAEIICSAHDLNGLDIGLYNLLGQKILDLNSDYEYNDAAHAIFITYEIPAEIKKGVYFLNVRNKAEFRASAIVVIGE